MRQTVTFLLVLATCTAGAAGAAPLDLADLAAPADAASFLLGVPTPEAAPTQGPTRVGEEVRATYSSPEVRLDLSAARAEPTLVWSDEIRFPGASYIAPHFERFVLPAGSYLVVRSPDASRVRTYAGDGKAGLGRTEGFWGTHIPGDVAVLELYSSLPVVAGAVRIDSYARGYAAQESIEGPGQEAICGVDDSDWAQCYTASEATVYDRSRAVLRLLIQGTSACTGWFVGSEGHVMTNEHCIGSSSAALNTDYEVMAEGSCAQNCASFGACPGTVVASSGTLIQTNSPLDYTLILLPTNPTPTYGFYRMRAAGAALNERIYIPGHPAAWGKRISVESSDSRDESGFCEVWSLSTTPCSGGPGDTGYFCDTRGGSSGSPVVGYSDHNVVSLHHCANCPNRGVPIEAVIDDLGANLPADAVSGDVPPPPVCEPKGAACVLDADCCSGKCRGPSGGKSCK
jgi:hypothetical protein